MLDNLPYNNYAPHLRAAYGGRVKKICIDGGFTCPNRDGRVGYGGCVFCGAAGAGEHLAPGQAIAQRMQRALATAKEGRRYIAYFQSFSGTYAPTDVLRKRYEAALCDPRVVLLDIATRPDCINEEKADLLAELATRVDVVVELGLQSADDATAQRIHRGYPTDTFVSAAELLHARKIPVIAHMMLGLPGEDMAHFLRTADLIGACGIEGVKMTQVYVMEGTVLAEQYRRGDYTPIEREAYIEAVIRVLCRLPRSVIIHRLTGDCPKGQLLAPLWGADKEELLRQIRTRMQKRGLRQGDDQG